MTRTLAFAAIAAIAAIAGAALVAQTANNDLGYTDTPQQSGLPYRVHDSARPHPPVVAAGGAPGNAPSDAVVLFGGQDLSRWTPARGPWKVENGYLEVVPNAGNLTTRESFGDVQLHVEWAAPAAVRGTSQNRGNSGIFLMGRYEIQVLDSFENPTYADGQAGAIYGQWPPLVNPARRPGEWQSYDIVFEAPRFTGAALTIPAYVTVFLNGVVLHHRKELMGPTVHRALARYEPHPFEAPLVLQDHQQPVRYRNIWIRRLGGYDRRP
jgi:hypothetical protein